MNRFPPIKLGFLAICLISSRIWAEAGKLVVHVKDAQSRPVPGIQIGVEGDGSSDVTMDDGKARIALAAQTKPNSVVTLQIIKSPPGKDYVLLSPWDSRARVPSFENESENYVEAVVVQRGDKAILENGSILASLVAKIDKANSPRSATATVGAEDPEAALAAVAKQYELTPAELDQAIRAWTKSATDPYERGLAALYERNYGSASVYLAESLDQREKTLAMDQKEVADAACFLAQSLYLEGSYNDSAKRYKRCLQLRPSDPVVQHNLALSLTYAGEYKAAESIFRAQLETFQGTLGPNDPFVASTLNDFGYLRRRMGDYEGAEEMFREALATREKVLGPDAPDTAETLRELASIRQDRGDYVEAEKLFRKALDIHEKTQGIESPDVAIDSNNLGLLLQKTGRLDEAEPLYRHALDIQQRTLGDEHPRVAIDLSNLASLLSERGNNTEAERLQRQALAIRVKAFGPDSIDVAESESHLAGLLSAKGNNAEAEKLYRHALMATEKSVGPDHPDVAVCLNNLGGFLMQSNQDYSAAQPLLERALAIAKNALGPDHPRVAEDMNNLAVLRQRKGDYTAAESLFRGALAIQEKAFGAEHPKVALALNNLAYLLCMEGEQNAANQAFQRAVAISDKMLGPDAPQSRTIRSNFESCNSTDHKVQN